jgi:hypothetical protein
MGFIVNPSDGLDLQLLSPEILQVANEFLDFGPSLFENSPQGVYRCSGCSGTTQPVVPFSVMRFQHYVTSTLTSLSESQPFQCADSLGP